MMTSRIVIETIHSHVLENNPLGDSPVRRVPVYLPPGYDDGEQRYPVVYLLPGFTGRGAFMLNDSAFDETIQERMDRLITAEGVAPMMLVLVDCFTRYGGSQYLNSSATGQYADHLITELVPYIDRRYRTSRRAIAGKSSGGYGALVHAMQQPDVFDAVACHSGDMFFEYAYKPDFIKFLNAADRAGIDSAETLHEFLAQFSPKMPSKPGYFFDLLHMSAMAACYSPNPDAVCGFDLPFHFKTGLPRPDVWARWLAHDPVTLLDHPDYATALRNMRLVYLDCGTRDEYALHYGARIFCQKLTALNIHFTHQEFEGGHRHTQHRYDISLTAIADVLAN